jgi:hypothetical protein
VFAERLVGGDHGVEGGAEGRFVQGRVGKGRRRKVVIGLGLFLG